MNARWFALRTHCQVPGTTGSGKSKGVEDWLREHIIARPRPQGFCLIDWHGTLYEAVRDYVAFVQPPVPVYLVNPSQPDFIVPFNPFRRANATNVSAHVSRLAETILQAWGTDTMSDLPTYRRLVKMLLTYCAMADETLQNAVQLLFFGNRDLCIHAASVMPDRYMAEQWLELARTKSELQWDRTVLSLRNRLDPFVSGDGIARFLGMPGPGLDLNQCIEDGAIVLVNLRESDELPEESAKVFAALVLSEFLHAAITHAWHERPYHLYLDECQNYLTDHAAKMLDQVGKAGLRLTLIHHDDRQFIEHPKLLASLRTNAGIKVVFRTEDAEEAKHWAERLFMGKINERWIKEILMGLETAYVEEDFYTYSESDTSNESESESKSHGGFKGEHGEGESNSASEGSSWGSSHAMGVVSGTRYAPRQHEVKRTVYEWSRDEKVAMMAAVLMKLPRGQCFVKLPGKDAFLYRVPLVEEVLLDPIRIVEFEKAVHEHSIPLHDADRIIRERQSRFLERSSPHEPRPRTSGKKRPPRLFEQG